MVKCEKNRWEKLVTRNGVNFDRKIRNFGDENQDLFNIN
jgi:hypothetical protein